MREGDAVSITNRIGDLPSWFELHPTEVSGFAACLMMQEKLENGYKPKDPVDGPNLWRVMVGDRVIWVRRTGVGTENFEQTLVLFRDNALVFGERLVHTEDVAWLRSFGALLEESPRDEITTRVGAGLTAVRKIGLPREIPEVGSGWHIGS